MSYAEFDQSAQGFVHRDTPRPVPFARTDGPQDGGQGRGVNTQTAERQLGMSNRITIEQLRKTPLDAANAIPLDQLQMLIEDCDEIEKQAKADKALIQNVLDHRFGDDARRLRMAAGKDTGTVSIKCGDFVVRSEMGKKVDWEQEMFPDIARALEVGGDDPYEFIKIEYKVSEKAFDAWPEHYRSLFEPARTVSPGASKYKIETKKGGR